jgi:hypothetical protein
MFAPSLIAEADMALELGKLRNALIEAGASSKAAEEAAQEVAAYENMLDKLESDMAVVKWMLGFNLAMTIAVLFRVFSH